MARRRRQEEDAVAAGALGMAGCGACGMLLIIPVVVIALNIALLIWVHKDAKSRGMDNAPMWMLLVMCMSVIGLILYLHARPVGVLMGCRMCGNQRLQMSVRCPHCGAG
jgi:hypothetical protein